MRRRTRRRADPPAPHGYQRLESATHPGDGRRRRAGRAALWSLGACAQPLAMEVAVGGERLISNCRLDARAPRPARPCGWSDAASTAALGDRLRGEPLRASAARRSGRGWSTAPTTASTSSARAPTPAAGWSCRTTAGSPRFGLRHERRLFLDLAADELRGEDRFEPSGPAARRPAASSLHRPLPPASRTRRARWPATSKSVLLRAPSAGRRLVAAQRRHRGASRARDPLQDGQPRRTSQMVLRGQVRARQGRAGALEAGRGGRGVLSSP